MNHEQLTAMSEKVFDNSRESAALSVTAMVKAIDAAVKTGDRGPLIQSGFIPKSRAHHQESRDSLTEKITESVQKARNMLGTCAGADLIETSFLNSFISPLINKVREDKLSTNIILEIAEDIHTGSGALDERLVKSLKEAKESKLAEYRSANLNGDVSIPDDKDVFPILGVVLFVTSYIVEAANEIMKEKMNIENVLHPGLTPDDRQALMTFIHESENDLALMVDALKEVEADGQHLSM